MRGGGCSVAAEAALFRRAASQAPRRGTPGRRLCRHATFGSGWHRGLRSLSAHTVSLSLFFFLTGRHDWNGLAAVINEVVLILLLPLL